MRNSFGRTRLCYCTRIIYRQLHRFPHIFRWCSSGRTSRISLHHILFLGVSNITLLFTHVIFWPCGNLGGKFPIFGTLHFTHCTKDHHREDVCAFTLFHRTILSPNPAYLHVLRIFDFLTVVFLFLEGVPRFVVLYITPVDAISWGCPLKTGVSQKIWGI